MRTLTITQAIAAVLMTLAMSACGGQPEPQGRRVFFIQPADGATVKSPVRLEFGAADFTIAAVPQGTPTETRPNLGHHHVAIDADCLPTGTPIPRAAPWVHFGDGKNVIDMQ